MDYDEADEQQTRLAIAQAIDIDHHYLETVESWNQDRINLIRDAARRTARSKGWKIRTGVVDAADDGTGVCVYAVVTASTPEEQARLDERANLLIQEMDWGEFGK